MMSNLSPLIVISAWRSLGISGWISRRTTCAMVVRIGAWQAI